MIIEKTAEINGLEIFYRECGEGFPLLMVHGMGSSLVWDEVIEPVSKAAKVIAIDLPGFGNSSKPKINYTIKYYVEFLADFVKYLEISKFNLAGLSLGGWICVDYMKNYPGYVEKLILISSAGLKPIVPHIRYPIVYDIVKIIMKNLIFSRKAFLKNFQKGAFFDQEKVTPQIFNKFYEYINSKGAKDAYLSALRNVFKVDPEFKNNLTHIDHPTLIIWGVNDPTFPIKYARQFNELISNSKLNIIPECGHTVTLEKPAEFCELIIDFLCRHNH
jgi:pimeloyl-ACP methyl ester carboxylesterase